MTNFARRAATVGAVFITATVAMSGAALAAEPSGWSDAPHVSAFKWLLFLLILPLAIGIVVSLLVLLPGVFRGEGLIPLPPKRENDSTPRSGH